ncbi:hypothetical protein EBQ81_01425 [bacterium]|nr:hypothetical protein [bacterium]
MIKPGWKSSEFWVTLVSFVFSGAYLTGLLNDHGQKEDLINEGSKGVEAIILIIGQLTVLYRYVKGRSDIKKIWSNNQNESNKLVDQPVVIEKEVKTDVKRRINKKRSRKTQTKNTRKGGRS